MTTIPVPIHHGSPAFRETEVGPFRITDVTFGPGTRIEPHYHDRPNVGVMLVGSFDLSFRSREFGCEPGTLFVEPAGEFPRPAARCWTGLPPRAIPTQCTSPGESRANAKCGTTSRS